MRTIMQLEKEIENVKKRMEKNSKKNFDSMLQEHLGKQFLIKSSRLDQMKEVEKLINKNYADMVSLIEHEFPDDRVAEKITDYIEDYKKELEVLITGGQSK